MNKEEKKTPTRASAIKSISLTSLGWELALPIFCGALLGYYLDKSLNTQYVLTIVLLLTGVFFGYYNLAKLISLESLRTKAARLRQKNREIES